MVARADYIAKSSGFKETPRRNLAGLRKHCESLSLHPHRNIRRDDLRPNLNLANYRGTTVIAYRIDEETKTVFVLDMFHSSQNYEAILQESDY